MVIVMSAERLEALRAVVSGGWIEVRYADTRHHYLGNIGYLRKTVRQLKDPRYGRVPVDVYAPTPKGRQAAAVEP